MRILAFLNQKGGVAKTTSVRNIAEFLKSQHKKILLIDLDPQSNLTASFGENKRTLQETIYQLFKLQVERVDYDIHKFIVNIQGIDIIRNNLKFSKADLEFGNAMSREVILKKILRNLLPSDYDYILLDCPPALNLITYNALVACDKVYIPLEAESFSLEGVADMLDTVEEIRSDLNGSLSIGGVFITRFKIQTNLHKTIIASLKEYFPTELMNTYVRENITVGEANAMKKSILEYSPNSNGAIDYRNLGREIIQREGI
ncbi:MAG: ParA family protein [Fusobacteria bacterium]|nr:ParA family protein [Fusobacteriota bacterium]